MAARVDSLRQLVQTMSKPTWLTKPYWADFSQLVWAYILAFMVQWKIWTRNVVEIGADMCVVWFILTWLEGSEFTLQHGLGLFVCGALLVRFTKSVREMFYSLTAVWLIVLAVYFWPQFVTSWENPNIAYKVVLFNTATVLFLIVGALFTMQKSLLRMSFDTPELQELYRARDTRTKDLTATQLVDKVIDALNPLKQLKEVLARLDRIGQRINDVFELLGAVQKTNGAFMEAVRLVQDQQLAAGTTGALMAGLQQKDKDIRGGSGNGARGGTDNGRRNTMGGNRGDFNGDARDGDDNGDDDE